MSTNLNMASVNKIKELVGKKDFKSALAELKSIDIEKSLNPQFMRLCGQVYAENKKYDDARKTLITAHILAPKSSQILDELIRLYLKMGYFTKAKQYYKIYTACAPSEGIESQTVLYNIKKALQAPDSELIEILKGICDKEYVDVWAFELALLYRKAGMNEESVKECEKIMDSFAQSNLYVKWARPLKMGSINVNKAFNCYPKDEVPESTGNIYQSVQQENEQLRKDYIEFFGGPEGDDVVSGNDDAVIVEEVDDDDAISVAAQITDTVKSTVTSAFGKVKDTISHPLDEEVEVEIVEGGVVEEGGSILDSEQGELLHDGDEVQNNNGNPWLLEEDTVAARQQEMEEATGEINDIQAALERIARQESKQEAETNHRKQTEEADVEAAAAALAAQLAGEDDSAEDSEESPKPVQEVTEPESSLAEGITEDVTDTEADIKILDLSMGEDDEDEDSEDDEGDSEREDDSIQILDLESDDSIELLDLGLEESEGNVELEQEKMQNSEEDLDSVPQDIAEVDMLKSSDIEKTVSETGEEPSSGIEEQSGEGDIDCAQDAALSESDMNNEEVATEEADIVEDAEKSDFNENDLEKEAFDMADENKPKLSLKLAGGGGAGGYGGNASRSSFAGGGMGMRGTGGAILSKEEREFMAQYDAKQAEREAAAKERARLAKEQEAKERAEREEAERQAKIAAEEAARKAEAEAKEAAIRAEEEAKRQAERQAAEEEARKQAEQRAAEEAKIAEERRVKEAAERAREEEEARKLAEQRAKMDAEERARAEAEAAKKAEQERRIREEEERKEQARLAEQQRAAEEQRIAAQKAEQERMKQSVNKVKSKYDQEREDAIAAIRAKVEAERAAKAEKKRKAQEVLDDQERRRIKAMPDWKRKQLPQDTLERLGLAIDENGALIDPAAAKQEEAEAPVKAPETVNESVKVSGEEAVNEAVEVSEAANENTEPIEVNAGREAEEKIVLSPQREDEAEGVKVEKLEETLENTGLTGDSLSEAGLTGAKLSEVDHNEITLENAAFAGESLQHDEDFEPTQATTETVEAEAEPENDVIQLGGEVETEPENDVIQLGSEVEAEPESDVIQLESEVEAEPESDVIQLGSEAEAEPESDVIQLGSEAEAEPENDVIQLGNEVEAEPESDVIQLGSEVEAEPESDVIQLGSEAEAESESDVIQLGSEAEAEPENDVIQLGSEAEAEPESDVIQLGSEAEAEPENDVIQLGSEAEAEPESDVIQTDSEPVTKESEQVEESPVVEDTTSVEEPAAEEPVKAEPERVEEPVKDTPKATKVIEGVEFGENGIPLAAQKYIGKYVASSAVRKQFRKPFEKIIKKRGIYRNIVVLSRKGCSISNVAIDFARTYHELGLCKTKVVATIKAKVLNKTDLSKILPKLKGGCLIVEHSGELSHEKALEVFEMVNNPENDIVLMLVGEVMSVTTMFSQNSELNSLFHSLFLLHDLSDIDLTDIAVAYMKEHEYDVDEDGMRALKNRIANLNHNGIDNVLAVVDAAIAKAEKRSKNNLTDVVFLDDYEDSGLNVLKEFDFE